MIITQSNQFRHKQSCCDYNEMIPEGELQTYISQTAVKIPAKMASTETQSTITHDDGIIKPKKLPNPCKESIDRQKLHRELLFNQKIGKNVLNQKSELQVALQKYKDSQIKKEIKQQKEECKTPFQKVIEERAKKIEMAEKTSDTEHENSDTPEFLQVHAKLRAKMDSK